jgi:RNA polymerase sigma-70 factor (ECF subfamily)
LVEGGNIDKGDLALKSVDVERFAAGDPDAVRQLFRLYGRAVFTVAYSALRDRGLAEEAVQLTFLNAWRAADRFDTDLDPKPWLYAIARRAAVDVYRRERRHGGRVPLDDSEADIAILPEPFETTWQAWEIRTALEQMPSSQREVIEATHFHGLSQEETAQKLGVAIGTVKSRSHRAHRRLAALLSHLQEATA